MCCPWPTRVMSLACKRFKKLNLVSQVRMKHDFFSDLVNFECVVKVHEQFISCNVIFWGGTLCTGNLIA